MKCRVASKHQTSRVTALEFYEQFFVFLFQALQNIGVQDDPNVVDGVLVSPHHSVECSVQFHARGHGRFHHTPSTAIGTIFVNSITEAFLRPLSRHFHQAELRNGKHMRSGFVALEPFLH